MPSVAHDPVTREAFVWWSRADWGARPPRSRPVPMSSTREGIFYHHTVSATAPAPVVWRGTQAYHMDSPDRRYNDIAYSFGIGVGGEHDGHIFEGRGYGIVGAHTGEYNPHAHAICFIADTDRVELTSKAKRAAVAVARMIEDRAGTRQRVRCHGDVAHTACPGRHARDWVHAGRPVDDPPAPPALTLEDLMAKPLHLPDHTGDAQWMLVVDGNGRVRRHFLSADDRYVYTAAGLLEAGDPVVLTGHAADVVMGHPEVPAVHASEQLLGVELRLTAALIALGQQVAGIPAADVDEDALAERIVELAGVGATPGEIAAATVRLLGETLTPEPSGGGTEAGT